ncbi:HutD/Ves family protein [Thalassotalea profundi]|uniref:HutD family protein n=1 Tax=Thalassotalea profundi TaxID=2036687 RepID=A0ABQ3IHS3_9GAMM|nr:HutD family protein [Thalassotalea profundi]GHE79356.1 hypothetical protein GCM10011501_04210 [Thalassotalea profundi]
MYSIKKPEQFITTPWKNGLGETTELAINKGGTLTEFDWRLSMAKVSQDGIFSNFKGYKRQLVLIKGNGIHLIHKHSNSVTQIADDKLEHRLDMAEFDGGNATYGKLLDGDITDFNIITNKEVVKSKVDIIAVSSNYSQLKVRSNSQTRLDTMTIETPDLVFIYNVEGDAYIQINSQANTGKSQLAITPGELFQWTSSINKSLVIQGNNLIIIQLKIEPDKIK